jgi:hypothetical protein
MQFVRATEPDITPLPPSGLHALKQAGPAREKKVPL